MAFLGAFPPGVEMATPVVLKLIACRIDGQNAVFEDWHLLSVQNQPQRAIEHLKRVLEISKEVGDHRGDEDVNGTIADILTGLGEFAEAAKYYDQYIQGLQADS